MLPRQLLVTSPFVQSPMNASPLRNNFGPGPARPDQNGSYFSTMISGSPTPLQNGQDNSRRRSNNYMSKPPAMRSLSVSSSSTSLTDYYSNNISNNYIPSNGKNLSNSRSIVIQDLPQDITLTQFLDNVKVGPVENCHFVREESDGKSISISFIDTNLAKHFYLEVSNNHKLAIALNAPDLKVSWTLSSSLSSFVSNAINNESATRNVYIGNLTPNITKEQIENDLSNYGNIEMVDFISDRRIAFVHFTNIASAIKAVDQLPLDPEWSSFKIFYGKDRCAQNVPSQRSSVSSNRRQQEATALKQLSDLGSSSSDLLSTTLSQNVKLANTLLASGGSNNIGNRCVYLGNLHPQTTVEEICNVVRAGLLKSIKLMSDRQICFITFIDPMAAVKFFASSSIDGLLIHGRSIKLGWGKHSGPLPNSIALLVTLGLSRNLYIGIVNEEDKTKGIPREEVLREDFKEFGDVEQINFFKDGLCAFVNFCNISSAIKCVDEFQKDEFQIKFDGRYSHLRIAFGKDRCGNPPKLKRVKKLNKKKLGPNFVDQNNLSTLESSDEHPHSDDALVFASMGIMSKSMNITEPVSNDLEDLKLQTANETENDTVTDKETTKDLELELKEKENDNEETIVKVITNDDLNSVNSANIDNSEENDEGDVLEKKEEIEKEQELVEDNSLLLSAPDSVPNDYELSDSDSISIIIGDSSNDLPLRSKSDANNEGTANTSVTNASLSKPPPISKKNSATQFRMSNNINSRSSSFSYDNFPVYGYNSNGFNSRQSSKSQLNKYYHSHSQQQPINSYATSGSQVMAQYLAQSQHENLLYATHVLAEGGPHGIGPHDIEEEEVEEDYDSPYFYDGFSMAQGGPPPQQYAKMYPYPIQQFPYILAPGPGAMGPPPLMQPILYGASPPTTPMLNGGGRNRNKSRGSVNYGPKSNGGKQQNGGKKKNGRLSN